MVLWGVMLVTLLFLGVFIKIGTARNFNCGFEIWGSTLSFDGIKLMIVFVVFELEIIVVVILLSGLRVCLLLLVTLGELMILYV